MLFKTGHFNLFPILEFVAENPIMPSPQNHKLQKDHGTLINKVMDKVPLDMPGWYLWGKFNSMGWWETIYLGKAGKQKTSSLRNRLYKELQAECIAMWSDVYGHETMVKQYQKLYGGKYDPTRSLRKAGAHFVTWVAVEDEISEEEIKKQEDLLIKIYRPTHNAARWNLVSTHDAVTEEIEKAIETELKSIMRNNLNELDENQ